MFQSAKELAFKGAKKVQNFVIDNSTGAVTAVGTGIALTSTQLMAAVPASVSTAVTDGVADVGTIGAAILGVVVAIVGFAWLRRVIK